MDFVSWNLNYSKIVNLFFGFLEVFVQRCKNLFKHSVLRKLPTSFVHKLISASLLYYCMLIKLPTYFAVLKLSSLIPSQNVTWNGFSSFSHSKRIVFFRNFVTQCKSTIVLSFGHPAGITLFSIWLPEVSNFFHYLVIRRE